MPRRRYFPGPVPRIIAHRGFAPAGEENTLAAFARALEEGATVLETDTRATSDGVALAFHDATTERVVSGAPELAIGQTAWTDLAELRVGGLEPIASLEDVLGHFPDVPVNIDVKSESAIRPAVSAIVATGSADRVCLTSFTPRIAREAVALASAESGHAIMASASADAVLAFRLAATLGAPDRVIERILAPYAALQIPRSYRGIPLVSERTVALAHRAGCEVHVWTIDSPEEMRSLLEMGVDGIVSNRVDRLRAVVASRRE